MLPCRAVAPRYPQPDRHAVPDRTGVYVFKQRRSPYYNVEAFINGKKIRKSLRTPELTTANKLAIDWHKRLLKEARQTGRRLDRVGTDPTVAEVFDSYRLTLEAGPRAYADQKWSPIESFWRTIDVKDVTDHTFDKFYDWRRARKTRQKTVLRNHSLHKDAMVIRQVLKFAKKKRHISTLPEIPKVGTIKPNPPPPLTEPEWQHLRAISQERIAKAPNDRTKQQRVDCDHFMRLMVASCARVGEIHDDKSGEGLRFRDCRYRLAPDGKRHVLVCTVTGKRGQRDIVAGTDAVEVVSQRAGKPEDLIFSHHSRDALRELLIAAHLRTDNKGRVRNAKALRSTAICLALLSGRDVVFVAKNAGTSVDVISRYYTKYLTAEMSIRESHPIEIPVSVGR